VLGLGYWGPNRLRAFGEIPNTRVRYVCVIDPQRLRRWSGRYPDARSTSDASALLEDPLNDAVVIATPAHTHFDLARRCIEAGKHVFVEKPLASSSRDALALERLAREQGVVLMCGHTFLYSPPVREMKRIIEEQELGELYFISASRVNLGPYRSDVSVIWDLAPHDFAILRYWLDSTPEWIAAVGRDVISPGIADVSFIDLGFADGLLSHIEVSWLAPSKLRRTVIVGSEKMAIYEDGAPEPVRVFDSGIVYRDPETFGEYHLSYRTGDIISPHVDTTEPVAAELADFVAAITASVVPDSTPELAVDVIKMVEAAETSQADGGARVPLDLSANMSVRERSGGLG
jgi:predicted dehydrogenase